MSTKTEPIDTDHLRLLGRVFMNPENRDPVFAAATEKPGRHVRLGHLHLSNPIGTSDA